MSCISLLLGDGSLLSNITQERIPYQYVSIEEHAAHTYAKYLAHTYDKHIESILQDEIDHYNELKEAMEMFK